MLESFDVFAKAYQLRNIWKFDIDYMIQLNKEYGPTDFEDPNDHSPLNWRHPATHALYWGAQGLEIAGRQGQYRIDEKEYGSYYLPQLATIISNRVTWFYMISPEKSRRFICSRI